MSFHIHTSAEERVLWRHGVATREALGVQISGGTVHTTGPGPKLAQANSSRLWKNELTRVFSAVRARICVALRKQPGEESGQVTQTGMRSSAQTCFPS